MDDYLNQLYTSTLPLAVWQLAVSWLLIFLCNQLILRKTHTLLNMQKHVAYDCRDVADITSPRTLIYQIAATSVIFAYAWLIELEVVDTFFVGGWVLISIMTVAANMRAMFWIKSLTKDGTATGTLTISSNASVRDRAWQCFATSLICLLAGLLACWWHILRSWGPRSFPPQVALAISVVQAKCRTEGSVQP